MRLGVRVGQGCAQLLDQKMRNLDCQRIELDEVWGFIGKKVRHLREDDDPTFGDVWTYCAIDAETSWCLLTKLRASATRRTQSSLLLISNRA